MFDHSTVGYKINNIIAGRLSVRRIIVGCILAINDRPTDQPTSILILYVGL